MRDLEKGELPAVDCRYFYSDHLIKKIVECASRHFDLTRFRYSKLFSILGESFYRIKHDSLEFHLEEGDIGFDEKSNHLLRDILNASSNYQEFDKPKSYLGSRAGHRNYRLTEIEILRHRSEYIQKYMGLEGKEPLKYSLSSIMPHRRLQGPSCRLWRPARYNRALKKYPDFFMNRIHEFETIRYNCLNKLLALFESSDVMDQYVEMERILMPLSNLLENPDPIWNYILFGDYRRSTEVVEHIISFRSSEKKESFLSLHTPIDMTFQEILVKSIVNVLNTSMIQPHEVHNPTNKLPNEINQKIDLLHNHISSLREASKSPENIDRNFFKLIDKNPFFVLLRSGIIGTYADGSNIGFGLTIPVLASGLSKHILGNFSYRFVGEQMSQRVNDEGNEAEKLSDSNDVLATNELSPSRQLQELWERL